MEVGKPEDAGECGLNNLQLTRLRCGGLRVWEKRGSGARGWRARLPGDDRLEEVLTQTVVGREGTPRGQAFGIPGMGAKSRGGVNGGAAQLMDRSGRRLLRSERKGVFDNSKCSSPHEQDASRGL